MDFFPPLFIVISYVLLEIYWGCLSFPLPLLLLHHPISFGGPSIGFIMTTYLYAISRSSVFFVRALDLQLVSCPVILFSHAVLSSCCVISFCDDTMAYL